MKKSVGVSEPLSQISSNFHITLGIIFNSKLFGNNEIKNAFLRAQRGRAALSTSLSLFLFCFKYSSTGRFDNANNMVVCLHFSKHAWVCRTDWVGSFFFVR